MRLFLAIELDEEVKDSLCDAVSALKYLAQQGNFTRRENLHLTLVFLGETNRLAAVKQALDSVEMPRFDLELSGVGKFERGGGDIWWVGLGKNPSLGQLHSLLLDALEKRGFQMEKRAFRPHLTLGREVVFHGGISQPRPARMEITRVSLMKSERIAGKLTYTRVYAKELA